MIAWLWNLLVGTFCQHKWAIISDDNLTSIGREVPYGKVLTLQCEKCGNIKSVRTI